MKITKIESITPEELAQQVRDKFRDSRFAIDCFAQGAAVNIQTIRLRSTKQFCGNHPKACEGNPNAKHRKLHCLEGADWVEFNDTLNDLLDGLRVSARVQSAQVHLREGTHRRVVYREGVLLGFVGSNAAWTWLKKGATGDYECWLGREAPASAFPKGTPGIYDRINYSVEG